MKIIVYHSSYGCATGCCGHVIKDDEGKYRNFEFDHFDSEYDKDPLEYAKKRVIEAYGVEHVKDLDWDNCIIVDGDNC